MEMLIVASIIFLIIIWIVNGIISLIRNVKYMRSYEYDDVIILTKKDWKEWVENRKSILEQNKAGGNRYMTFTSGGSKKRYQVIFK